MHICLTRPGGRPTIGVGGTAMVAKTAKRTGAGVQGPRKASGKMVSAVRQSLCLNRKVFSRLTGFSERAIAGWESGAVVSEPGLRRIRELERFQQRLAEVVR